MCIYKLHIIFSPHLKHVFTFSFSFHFFSFFKLRHLKYHRWSEIFTKHANNGYDSRSPASSMAAVNLRSWFPSLGYRSSSCAPLPPSPVPLTQQMWLDHRGGGLTTSGSDYSQTIQLYQLHPLCWALLHSFSHRWRVTHSQLTNIFCKWWFMLIWATKTRLCPANVLILF